MEKVDRCSFPFDKCVFLTIDFDKVLIRKQKLVAYSLYNVLQNVINKLKVDSKDILQNSCTLNGNAAGFRADGP